MIKNYREYLNESAGVDLTQEQKIWLDKFTKGRWQVNSQTGLVDVEGSFACSKQGLDSFKGVRFGRVSGYFSCWGNDLTSIEGAPQSVGDFFYCFDNNLTSLVGAPQSVCGSFDCGSNKLTSLEGAPQGVGGGFDCSSNKLTSLVGAPGSVEGYFRCYDNKLTSLEGAPQGVRGLDCSNNEITSLKGLPMEIGGEINIGHNPIWGEIGPMGKGMSEEEENFFYKIVAASEDTDKKSLERIARAVERMKMI